MNSLLWLGIIVAGCLILYFVQKRKPTEDKLEKQKREYEEILQVNQVPENHYKIVVGQSKVYNIYNCPAIVWKEDGKVKTLYLRANAKPILAEQEEEDYMFLASQPYVDFLRFDGTEYPDWAVQPEYIKQMFMPYVNSRKASVYEEEYYTTTTNFWYQEEILYTSGWGYNFGIGVIAYPARWIRLGASFKTPTLYELTDTWRTETLSMIDGRYHEWITPTSYFNYSMMTPWRANGSVAFIFGNFGMITADYEYVDYKSVRLSAYNYDYNTYNEALKETFSSTMNIRLGTEWRYMNYCFRGGYAFYGSPYGIMDMDYRREALSCGIGYTKHLFTIDFAYVYTLQNHIYNLYSQYTNYYDAVNDSNLNVYENMKLHSFVVTLKMKMY